MLPCPIAEQQEAEGKASKGESRPRENWEEPRLRLAQVVDSINVGLDRPG